MLSRPVWNSKALLKYQVSWCTVIHWKQRMAFVNSRPTCNCWQYVERDAFEEWELGDEFYAIGQCLATSRLLQEAVRVRVEMTSDRCWRGAASTWILIPAIAPEVAPQCIQAAYKAPYWALVGFPSNSGLRLSQGAKGLQPPSIRHFCGPFACPKKPPLNYRTTFCSICFMRPPELHWRCQSNTEVK